MADTTEFSGFGFSVKLPLSPWQTTALVILVAGGVLGWKVWTQQSVFEQNVEHQALLARQAELVEYNKHLTEVAEPLDRWDDADVPHYGRYPSDNCLVVRRKVHGYWRTKIVRDLALDDADMPPVRPVPAAWLSLPTAHASAGCIACLNPHPGAFQWWEGDRNGDWVQIWRQWPEGCKHYQWFDKAHGVWDTNPDGTPRICWQVCVH